MQIVEKINWIDDYEFSGGTGPNRAWTFAIEGMAVAA
jgi:hypothetical protein